MSPPGFAAQELGDLGKPHKLLKTVAKYHNVECIILTLLKSVQLSGSKWESITPSFQRFLSIPSPRRPPSTVCLYDFDSRDVL